VEGSAVVVSALLLTGLVREPKASPEHRLLQRHHAIAQYIKRYGIRLKLTEYLDFCDRAYAHIHGNGAAGIAGPFSGYGKNRYLLSIGGRWVIAAWDSEQRQIVTFIPTSCAWPREEGSEW
jgi:hypothetical protein